MAVTADDMQAAATHFSAAIAIRDASNLQHAGTHHGTQKAPPEYPGLRLYADMVEHTGAATYTLLVSDHFGLTMGVYMHDKSLKSQQEATMTAILQFNALAGKPNGVKEIIFDGESACRGLAFRNAIGTLGVYVHPGDPTYHQPRVERAIQEIKQMASRILSITEM